MSAPKDVMSGAAVRLRLVCHRGGHGEATEAAITQLVIAGWTGRDIAAVEHHIEELARIGVAPPSAVPLFYRVAASLLTTAGMIEVLGDGSSGEAEAVLLSLPDGLWVGLGSDHTDRKVEAYSVAVSKQLCSKPLAPEAWPFEEVADHWDALILRSYVAEDGKRVPYQEGTLATNRTPRNLVQRYAGDGGLPVGTAMLCGTVPVIGGIRPAGRFELELEDPVRGRTLRHGYDVRALPVVS
jgi:hypothetical protein